jgi:hypothetical protein
MRNLRVPQGSFAVTFRGGVSGFGEGVTPRLLQRHQERQVRLAAAAGRVLGVLGSAYGATHSQWSVVSGQWSVVSGQWSVVSGQ